VKKSEWKKHQDMEGEGKGNGHQHGQKPRIPEQVTLAWRIA